MFVLPPYLHHRHHHHHHHLYPYYDLLLQFSLLLPVTDTLNCEYVKEYVKNKTLSLTVSTSVLLSWFSIFTNT